MSSEENSLSLPILELSRTAQGQFGLRHNDYERYRQYCTRRLRRIRSSKQVRLMFGKGRKFQPNPLTTEKITSNRHLEVALFMAERAWSFGHQLKQDNNGGENTRKTNHSLRKFRKALKYAEELATLCQETADTKTQVESEAYKSYMLGQLMMEEKIWDEAYLALNTCSYLVNALKEAKEHTGENDESLQSIIQEVQPTVRFCKYKLQRQNPDLDINAAFKTRIPRLDGLLRTCFSAEKIQLTKSSSSADTSEATDEKSEKTRFTVDHVAWADSVRITDGEVLRELRKAQDFDQQMLREKNTASMDVTSTTKSATVAHLVPTDELYLVCLSSLDSALSRASSNASNCNKLVQYYIRTIKHELMFSNAIEKLAAGWSRFDASLARISHLIPASSAPVSFRRALESLNGLVLQTSRLCEEMRTTLHALGEDANVSKTLRMILNGRKVALESQQALLLTYAYVYQINNAFDLSDLSMAANAQEQLGNAVSSAQIAERLAKQASQIYSQFSIVSNALAVGDAVSQSEDLVLGTCGTSRIQTRARTLYHIVRRGTQLRSQAANDSLTAHVVGALGLSSTHAKRGTAQNDSRQPISCSWKSSEATLLGLDGANTGLPTKAMPDVAIAPGKPLHFDVALSLVTPPDLSHRVSRSRSTNVATTESTESKQSDADNQGMLASALNWFSGR